MEALKEIIRRASLNGQRVEFWVDEHRNCIFYNVRVPGYVGSTDQSLEAILSEGYEKLVEMKAGKERVPLSRTPEDWMDTGA